MVTASVTHTFAADTLAEAAEVNDNFSDLVSFLNTEAIQRDASVAFTNVPSGPSTDPSSNDHLVRKAYVDVPRYAATLSGDLPSVGSATNLVVDTTVLTSKSTTETTTGFSVQDGGIYIVGMRANWETSSSGTRRSLRLRKNSSTAFVSDTRESGNYSAGFGLGQTLVSVIDLANGDTVEMQYHQDSGGFLSFTGTIWCYGMHGTF